MPLIGSYVDTFSGTLDAGWTVAGAAITGGVLGINCSQNAGAAVYSSARRAGYTFANSQVLWEVTAMPATVGNQANAQMWLLDPTPANTVDRLGFEYRAAAGELDMLGQTGATYAPIGTTVTVTYDATAMRWLRLRHTGTTIVWETSPDGATANWTIRRTLAQAQVPSWVLETDTVTLSFEAFRTTGTNDTLRIDNLNNPPAAVTQPTGTLQEPVTVIRRNLCPNPALANDATGWTTYVFGAGNATPATSRVSVGAEFDRPWVFRGVVTADTAAHLASAKVAVVPGRTYSATMQWRFSATISAANFGFQWYNASGALLTDSQIGVTAGSTPGVVRREALMRVAPANAATAAVVIYWISSGPMTVDATAARVEDIFDSQLPYADGATAGWAWTGTAGSSASSLTYAIPSIRRNLLSNPALASNDSGWLALSSQGGTPAATSGRVPLSGNDRPFAYRFDQSVAGVSVIRSPAVPVDPGAYRRVSISAGWLFSSVPDNSGQVGFLVYDQAGQLLDSSAVILSGITAGLAGRTSMVRSIPPGAVAVGVQIAAVTGAGPITFYALAVRIEAVEDDSMPYRDGDSYGWAWDVTPGASTSSTGPDRLRRSPRALQAVTRSYTF